MNNDKIPPRPQQIVSMTAAEWVQKFSGRPIMIDFQGAKVPVKRVSFPEVRRASELKLHSDDLLVTDTALRGYLQMFKILELTGNDRIMQSRAQHHWEASIISYCRCFDPKGKQGHQLIAKNFLENIPNALTLHDQIRDLRNKTVAHDVNGHRETQVSVVFHPVSGEPKICTPVMNVLPKDEFVISFLRLVNIARKYVDTEITNAEQAILSKAKALSPDERARLQNQTRAMQFEITEPRER